MRRRWILVIHGDGFREPDGRFLTSRGLVPRFAGFIRGPRQDVRIRHRQGDAFQKHRGLFGLAESEVRLSQPEPDIVVQHGEITLRSAQKRIGCGGVCFDRQHSGQEAGPFCPEGVWKPLDQALETLELERQQLLFAPHLSKAFLGKRGGLETRFGLIAAVRFR